MRYIGQTYINEGRKSNPDISKEELNNLNKTICQECKEYISEINVVNAVKEMFIYINKEINKHDYEFRNSAFYQNGSGGSVIGSIIDSTFSTFLTKNNSQNYKFKRGIPIIEPDNICINNESRNTEVKSTGSGNYKPDGSYSVQYIHGSKTNSGGKRSEDSKNKYKKYTDEDMNKYVFYIFITYHIPRNDSEDITINDIYIGKLKPGDWKTSGADKNSGSSNIPVWKFNNQFFLLYSRFNKSIATF